MKKVGVGAGALIFIWVLERLWVKSYGTHEISMAFNEPLEFWKLFVL